MKKKEKRMILILGIITIIAIIMLLIIRGGKKDKETASQQVKEEFVEVLSDGTRLNTSSKLHEAKTFEGMDITNFQLTEDGDVTLLLGTITNNTDTEKGGYPVDVVVVDKEGKEIAKIGLYMPPVKPGESTQLNTNATADFANAYDFSIIKK